MHAPDQVCTDAVGLDVLDRRDEARLAERARPTAALDLIHAAAARELVERGRGFGAQDDPERGKREAVRQLEGDELEPEAVAQHVERGEIEGAGRALVVLLPLEGAAQVDRK